MHCCHTSIEVPALSRKPITLAFDSGDLSSDAGLIPLALADQRMQLTQRLADAIDDSRDERRIDHSLHDLLRERVSLIAQGYADQNDATTLRHDLVLKLALGRTLKDAPLASQSTLSASPRTPACTPKASGSNCGQRSSTA